MTDTVAWRVTAGNNTERHLFENKRDAQLMFNELEENGWLDVLLMPLYTAQPEYLSGCFHKLGPDSCQNKGGCQSEACDHYGKTEYRPRMTLLARDQNVLYPKVET